MSILKDCKMYEKRQNCCVSAVLKTYSQMLFTNLNNLEKKTYKGNKYVYHKLLMLLNQIRVGI